jgi:hypothetical protein
MMINWAKIWNEIGNVIGREFIPLFRDIFFRK